VSDGDWTECCGNIFAAIGLAFLIQWALTNPFLATVVFLGVMMVAVPLFIFIGNVAFSDIEAKQKIKWGVAVGYLIGFFTLILSILFSFVRDLFAILGVCAFVTAGIIALAYHVVKDSAKRSERAHAKALVWELEDQMQQLKEQLKAGFILQQEYEQKMKLLEDQLEQLKATTTI
jgi:hypothetical protein